MMSFFTYAIRMFGYSFLTNPWWCFPFELLEVVSYQLMWVAALTYCPLLAPKGLLATMTGLAGSVHYSVGRGMGAFMGGFLIANFGTKGGFQAMGYISIGGGVAYVLLHHCYFKQRIERDDKDEKEATVKNSEEAKPMLTKNQDSPKQAKIV
ncbi:unnamed protein product [Meganyctiphanes norvegica]|uniref:Major facilitator superfamily associated domain-containing protein n=1 Tax=Meganyctiphanes norvegica TaxID=48144 RepID=A0AAV2Q8N2_MEGNR